MGLENFIKFSKIDKLYKVLYHIDIMNIPEKIKLIKQISGLSQQKLSDKLGVSFVTLNSWINKRSTPHKRRQESIDTLYKKYTGQKVIPNDILKAKKELICKKSKKYKNILNKIISRKDIYDQFILSLTYNTNSIEGSTLTENETADILFENISLKNKSLIEQMEAKNHQTALQFLFRQIKPNFKITEALILKLHSVLMNSIRDDAGAYRNHGVRIVGANIATAKYLKVPKLMNNLIKDINKKDKNTIKHIAKIHGKFEQIHPFSDGNGRIGRLLIISMLLRRNLPPAVIKQENKRLYYNYLDKSQRSGDSSLLEDFLYDSVFEGFNILEV